MMKLSTLLMVITCLTISLGNMTLAQNKPNAKPSQQESPVDTSGQQEATVFSTSDIVASLALLVSVISLANTIHDRQQKKKEDKLKQEEEKRKKDQDKIRFLLGEKEAVANKSFQIFQRGELDVQEEFKEDQLTALCLAAVLEGSDRARAIVIGALKKLVGKDEYRRVINRVICEIEKEYSNFKIEVTDGQRKIERGQTRIEDLKSSLRIECKDEEKR